METNNNSQAQQPQAEVPATQTMEFLMSPIGQEVKRMEMLSKLAQFYCMSDIVPQRFQGEKNRGNVFIALDMANRLGAMPMLVMQNLYTVHGTPAWAAKFLIAMFNNSGKYSHIQWESRGKIADGTAAMRAFAYEKSDTERKNPLYGSWITQKMAKDENWGAKWKTIPEQMLRYRSATWFINAVAPEITLGIPTTDEVEDTQVLEEGRDFNVVSEDEKVMQAGFAEDDAKAEPQAEQHKEENVAEKKEQPKAAATDAQSFFD